jgi:hypothetical protein
VGGDLFDVLPFADIARKGTWPVAGGSMDQTPWASQAFRYIWNLEDQLMRRHGHHK